MIFEGIGGYASVRRSASADLQIGRVVQTSLVLRGVSERCLPSTGSLEGGCEEGLSFEGGFVGTKGGRRELRRTFVGTKPNFLKGLGPFSPSVEVMLFKSRWHLYPHMCHRLRRSHACCASRTTGEHLLGAVVSCQRFLLQPQ